MTNPVELTPWYLLVWRKEPRQEQMSSLCDVTMPWKEANTVFVWLTWTKYLISKTIHCILLHSLRSAHWGFAILSTSSFVLSLSSPLTQTTIDTHPPQTTNSESRPRSLYFHNISWKFWSLLLVFEKLYLGNKEEIECYGERGGERETGRTQRGDNSTPPPSHWGSGQERMRLLKTEHEEGRW